jgi:hypothetical protein
VKGIKYAKKRGGGRGDDHKNRMRLFKDLIEKHWARKAQIYMKTF